MHLIENYFILNFIHIYDGIEYLARNKNPQQANKIKKAQMGKKKRDREEKGGIDTDVRSPKVLFMKMNV